ncbi:hypothetical protein [Sphingomonas mesophila]|uniref:hypothetical protein n=1 Tax=Sphingomonas mesophila TaxID=2303576 RepID=UPI0013C36E24|nr:hypothetical protein [Sphingomonas mesophila]
MTAKKTGRTTAKRKLPPDPDGTFKRAAARGKKVIALYDDLNGEVERDGLVKCLIFDLICLSQRDPELGDVDEEYATARHTYVKFVKENEWIVGTPDYDSRTGKGIPPPYQSK